MPFPPPKKKKPLPTAAEDTADSADTGDTAAEDSADTSDSDAAPAKSNPLMAWMNAKTAKK